MTYALRYLREVVTDKPEPDWHTRDFSLFEVISPPPAEDADLDELICHDRNSIGPYPPTRYLAVGPAQWEDQEQLTIVVFTTEHPPKDVAEGACTEMTYLQPPPQPPGERAKAMFEREWIAYSRTAMGITGDVYLTPTTIDFARRASFQIRYLGETKAQQPEPYWHTSDFSLFEILDPRPLPILRHNQLCGQWKDPNSRLPRYIAVGLTQPRPDEDDLLVLVFDTARPPDDVANSDGLCGEFGYFMGILTDGYMKRGRELKELFEKR
jgi:hypothetical protein